MSNIDAVLITINSVTRIPFINVTGPILSPISVTRATANNLVKMGYPVKYHDDRVITETPILTVLDTVGLEEDVASGDTDTSEETYSTAEKLDSNEPLEVASENVEIEKFEEPSSEDEVNEDDEDDSGSEDESEDDSETDELKVYPITHYKTWNVKKLVSYLQSASEYLEEEEVQSLETLSKAKLIKLIELRLILESE